MSTQIQLRRDTAANWTSNDPTLAEGEMGLETDTGLMKMGDGATAWTSLAYWPPKQALTPVFSGLTVGDATLDGEWTRSGYVVNFWWKLTWGTTTTITDSFWSWGIVASGLPAMGDSDGTLPGIHGLIYDVSGASSNFNWPLVATDISVNSIRLYLGNDVGTAVGADVHVTNTVPLTFVAGDLISCAGSYIV